MESNTLSIIIITGLIVLGFLFIFYVIPQLTPPAELKISLQNNPVYQGQDQILFYKITPSKELLEDVKITILIDGKSVAHNIQLIDESYYGHFVINTTEFYGAYQVDVVLDYTHKGKLKDARLFLRFDVY